MKTHLLALMATLALAGCSGANDDIDREGSEQQKLSVAEPAKRPFSVEGMFAKLDVDGDGLVLVNELQGRAREHLSKADVDHDGVLTLAELKAGHDKMKAEHFARADQNGDGKIAQTEVDAKHWEHLKVADADGDGLITQVELDAAHGAGKLGPGMRHHAPSVEGLLEHFDADHDGKLSFAEVPEHFKTKLQASDADGDGTLDQAELGAHVAEMKARFEQHQ